MVVLIVLVVFGLWLSFYCTPFSGALHWAEELYEVNPVQERVQGYLNYFKSQLKQQSSTTGRRGDGGDENVAT